jgi:hypothetical protein
MTDGIQQPGVSDAADQEGSASEQKKDVVSYDTHRRLLDQHKKNQAALADMQRQIDSFNAEKEAQEEKKMQETGQYQQLLTARDQKIADLAKAAEDAKLEAQQTRDRFNSVRKVSAFRSKLPAQLINNDLLGLANLDGVAVDDSGDIDPVSLDNCVNDFVKNYGAFAFNKQASNPPNSVAAAHGTPLTYEQEVKSCKTQEEFDKIRAKYGRE